MVAASALFISFIFFYLVLFYLVLSLLFILFLLLFFSYCFSLNLPVSPFNAPAFFTFLPFYL